MSIELGNAIRATDADEERAKRLPGNKTILEHILARTVDEFQGMNPEDIVPY